MGIDGLNSNLNHLIWFLFPLLITPETHYKFPIYHILLMPFLVSPMLDYTFLIYCYFKKKIIVIFKIFRVSELTQLLGVLSYKYEKN